MGVVDLFRRWKPGPVVHHGLLQALSLFNSETLNVFVFIKKNIVNFEFGKTLMEIESV